MADTNISEIEPGSVSYPAQQQQKHILLNHVQMARYQKLLKTLYAFKCDLHEL